MALVTFTGFPASGKSARALELEAFLQAKLAASPPALARLKVAMVSDDGLELSRSAYDGMSRALPARPEYVLELTLPPWRPVWLRRQPGREASQGDLLLGGYQGNGQGYDRDRGWDELHQGKQVSDVLPGQGSQRQDVHRESPRRQDDQLCPVEH